MADRGSSETPRVRILVADDEPHIRRILATFLESAGFDVDQANDGTEAAHLLAGSTTYHLALLDLMMPGLTGLEVLEEARRSPERTDLPVVILTAKGQDTDREAALALGANAFITKPFSPKKLLALIRQLTDLS